MPEIPEFDPTFDADVDTVGDNDLLDMNEFSENDVTFEDPETPELDEDNVLPLEYAEHDANLAFFLPEDTLMELSQFCQDRFLDDDSSLEDYKQIVEDGFRNLGLKIEELNSPFPGACSVQHPLVLESSQKMQAKIMGELFNGRPLVDARIGSGAPEDLVLKAQRATNYMNYQYMCEFTEFHEDTERLGLRYSMTGNGYRKYYYSTQLGRAKTCFVTEDKFLYNDNASNLADVDFATELETFDKYEFDAKIRANEFKNPNSDSELPTGEEIASTIEQSYIDSVVFEETGDPSGVSQTVARHPVKFHHLFYSFPEPYNDGSEDALPYIVAYHEPTQKILSVVRNWAENDPNRTKLVWHSHYRLVPGLGSMGWGFIQMLGNSQMALTLMLRSVIDAGQFANLQAGFKDSRFRFTKQGQLPIGPGQFLDVDTTQSTDGKLSDGIRMFDFKEPSQVLERLIGSFDGRIQKFADSTEAVVGDSTNYGPVGTTVALLEASAKFHNDILKRFHRSLETEFKILANLNRMTLQPGTTYYWKGVKHEIGPDDFDGTIEFISTADPTFSSQAQRLQRANMKIQTARLNPELHDLREAYQSFYREIGLDEDEIKRLLPPPGGAVQQDPMSDIVAVTKGQPIAAFPGQDHQAHIDFKSAFLSDPQAGANPAFGPYVAQVQANIIEHGLLKYQEEMIALVGDPQAAASEFAQAEAAKILQQLHQVAVNDAALAAGDATMILAKAEASKAEIAQRKQALEERKQDFVEKIDPVKLGQKDTEIQIKGLEAGANVVLQKEKLEGDRLMAAKAAAAPKVPPRA